MAILGASFDDQTANRAFRAKCQFPYPLLCDVDKQLAIAYGAADAKASTPKRITVVVGKDGKVQQVYGKVAAATHPQEVLDAL